MKDIAAAVGVARSTVSMALRNHPGIPQETRLKVREAADRLGYRVNPLVSTLMANLKMTRSSGKAAPLAVIHSHEKNSAVRNDPRYKELINGIKARANFLGYNIEEFWSSGVSDARVSQILSARGITGIIIPPVLQVGRRFELDWKEFAAVTIGYSMDLPEMHRACTHQFHVTTLAMRHLSDLGYQRIGLALWLATDLRVDHNYKAGFLLAQSDVPANRKVPILWMKQIERAPFMKWLLKHRPDAVLCCHAEIKDWLEDEGFRTPEDIGFVHLDALHDNKLFSGVDQRRRLVGQNAVDLLIGMLHRNERGAPDHTKTLMIEGEWIAGKTVKSMH